MPEHSGEIRKWLKTLDLGLNYHGQRLPSISYTVLVRLFNKNRERVSMTGEEKHALLEDNAYSCALCGQRGRMEWDHTQRFSESFGPQVFQAICRQCHLAKTAQEPQDLDGDPLVSHFGRTVWDAYVLSPRPPPLVWKAKVGEDHIGCRIADVRRCRKRALEYPVPVFSPLDDIQETGTTLGDVVFCSKAPKSSCVTMLGYTGPGWMHRCQAEFLLHHGVITWADLPWKLTASGSLPADIFRKPLRQMEEAWGEAGLAKQAINSMIGLWCLDEAFSYRLLSSDEPGDVPEGAFKRITQFEGGAVTDNIAKTRLASTTSMRPLHDLCMCTEAVRVGQMIYALKRQRSTSYEFKTDSVLFRPLKRARTEALETLRFRDLDLRDRFEPCRGERRLDDYHTLTPLTRMNLCLGSPMPPSGTCYR